MKSSIIALLLALFPGLGHLYIGNNIRGVLYPILFIGAIGLGFVTGILFYVDFIFLFFFIVAGVIWAVNMIDIIITLIMRTNHSTEKIVETTDKQLGIQQNERTSTILLSMIPGVGHFYLGLTYRGLSLLTLFFGIIIMVIFISFVTSSIFLVFLLALPILWIYSLFDSIQLLNKKQADEPIEDRTIIEDFDRVREVGKKSKMLATVLSIFPGAGHMYLGLQKRGLQLMAAFLLSVYILDVLNLGIFLFIIPILWFFSFFDALQLANRMDTEVVEDVPFIRYLENHQKWIGIGLLVLGCFYLFDAVLLPVLADTILEILHINIWHYYHQYFQVTIVCLLFIGGGFKLLLKSRKAKKDDKMKEDSL